MITKRNNMIVGLLALVCLILSPFASATNGYFTHGLGVKNKALAGAGTASPDESIASANNPASAVLVGTDWELGLSVFSPRRSYTASTSMANGNGGAFTLGAGKTESDSEYFPIPYVGKTWRLSDDSAIAANFYGRGGMNTDYTSGEATLDPDGPGPAPVMTMPGAFAGGDAGVDLMQAFLDVTYAKKMDRIAVGIGGVLALQRFEANGFMMFGGYTKSFAASGGTQMPTSLTNTGAEMSSGFGAKIGIIAQVSDSVSLAAAYQSKIGMSEFDDYSDLFAESGGFDIPASLRLGASVAASPNVKVHLDYEHTAFSDVDSVGNGLANLFGCPTAGAGGTNLENCMGGAEGPGFGWDDVGTIKLGVEWVYSPDLTLRFGYSKADQPIDENQLILNVVAPAVVEQHITLGLTKQLASGNAFSAAFMIAPNNEIKGPNPFDPTQTIQLEMNQFELELSYSF